MAYNFKPPAALAGNERQQLGQMYSYLFQMSEQLNVALTTVDGRISGVYTPYSSAQRSATGPDNGLDVPTEAYVALKALIIKTATEVNARMDLITQILTSDYLAKSEFGEFQSTLTNQIETSAEGVVMSFGYDERLNAADLSLAGFEEYQAHTESHIKIGVVKYNDDGTTEAGVVIGKDLAVITVDGKEIVRSPSTYACFTSDRLTFWRDGNRLNGTIDVQELNVENIFADQLVVSKITAAAREELSGDIDGLTTRISSAELNLAPDAITATVRASVEYGEDRSALQGDIDGVEGGLTALTLRVSTAETKITPSAITSTVRQSSAYIADLGALSASTGVVAGNVTALATRVSTAESKITPTAITSTVRTSTEYVADQTALQDGIDGVADDLTTEVTTRESRVTQLVDSIDLRVMEGDLATYLRLDRATRAVEIGDTGSGYYVQIPTDRLNIVQRGAGVIAYFAYNKMWAQAAEVEDYVQVGDVAMWRATNGDLCIG